MKVYQTLNGRWSSFGKYSHRVIWLVHKYDIPKLVPVRNGPNREKLTKLMCSLLFYAYESINNKFNLSFK